MLTDISFLLKYRERPKQWQRWFVVMAKRTILLFRLITLLIKPIFFRFKGAKIGKLVVLGKSKINGNIYNLNIGDQTSLGRCNIALHDSVIIGRCVVINDGAILLTASHGLSDPQWRQKKAPIIIGDYAWISTNAIILPGVKIGKGAVVGAGAVVRNDVPEYAIVTGNPATIQNHERTRTLSYSPVLLNAPFEAWIGRNIEYVNTNGNLV